MGNQWQKVAEQKKPLLSEKSRIESTTFQENFEPNILIFRWFLHSTDCRDRIHVGKIYTNGRLFRLRVTTCFHLNPLNLQYLGLLGWHGEMGWGHPSFLMPLRHFPGGSGKFWSCSSGGCEGGRWVEAKKTFLQAPGSISILQMATSNSNIWDSHGLGIIFLWLFPKMQSWHCTDSAFRLIRTYNLQVSWSMQMAYPTTSHVWFTSPKGILQLEIHPIKNSNGADDFHGRLICSNENPSISPNLQVCVAPCCIKATAAGEGKQRIARRHAVRVAQRWPQMQRGEIVRQDERGETLGKLNKSEKNGISESIVRKFSLTFVLLGVFFPCLPPIFIGS